MKQELLLEDRVVEVTFTDEVEVTGMSGAAVGGTAILAVPLAFLLGPFAILAAGALMAHGDKKNRKKIAKEHLSKIPNVLTDEAKNLIRESIRSGNISGEVSFSLELDDEIRCLLDDIFRGADTVKRIVSWKV